MHTAKVLPGGSRSYMGGFQMDHWMCSSASGWNWPRNWSRSAGSFPTFVYKVARGKLMRKLMRIIDLPSFLDKFFGFQDLDDGKMCWKPVYLRDFTGKHVWRLWFRAWFVSKRPIDGKAAAGHPYGGWNHADQRSWQPRTFGSLAGCEQQPRM